MASTISVNNTPQVFNNALVSIDGETDNDIQGYINSITYTTGTQTEHVQTLNQNAEPITTNAINSSPSGSITFAPGAFKNFYQFLNSRFQKFTLSFIYYTTGNLEGSKQTFTLSNCQLDTVSGGVNTNSPSNTQTFGFKCTSIVGL